MVPQIVFDNGVALGAYEPRHTTWGTAGLCPPSVPTSGICQPPVHAIALARVRTIAARRDDETRAEVDRAVVDLYPRLAAWHRWLHSARDPDGTGLVTVFHPWESGLDNSPRWDDALANVPMRVDSPGTRPDLAHVADAAERPTDDEYRRYFTLVRELVEVGYDPARSHRTHPFRMADVLFTAILAAADDELAELAAVAGQPAAAERHRADAELSRRGLDACWDPRPLRLPRPRPGGRPVGGRRHDRRIRPAGRGLRRRPRRGAGPPAARPELRRRRGAALGRAAHHRGDRPGLRPPVVLAGADVAGDHLVAVVGPRARRPPHCGRQAAHGRDGAAAHQRVQRVRRPRVGRRARARPPSRGPRPSPSTGWPTTRWPPRTWCRDGPGRVGHTPASGSASG